MDAVTIDGALLALADTTASTGPTATAVRRARGRALLQELVAEIAGVPACGVLIEARCPDCGGPHGRPVVMQPASARDVRVTLAYAGTHVVAAAVAGRSVGVDAELRGDEARAQAVHAVLTDDPLLHWTRIEAALKADGRALRVDPERVVFEQRGSQLTAAVPDDPRHYRLHDVAFAEPFADPFVVTLAIET